MVLKKTKKPMTITYKINFINTLDFQMFPHLIFDFPERDNNQPLYGTINLVWSYPSFIHGLTNCLSSLLTTQM